MKTCLCCGYKTLEEKSIFDICPICFWEDDTACWGHANFKGGANGDISLREAQKNYMILGACDKDSIDVVRKPNSKDEKDTLWRPYEDLEGNIISIDIIVTNVESILELHTILKEKLMFLKTYGMKWDGLRDAITGSVELPKKITFYGWNNVKRKFPHEAETMMSLFNELNVTYQKWSCIVEYK